MSPLLKKVKHLFITHLQLERGCGILCAEINTRGTDKDNGKERTYPMATEMKKKYELTEETRKLSTYTVLHRIEMFQKVNEQ